jgi:hypothetical protein
VEQMAASASSLRDLANEQVQAVAVFTLPGGDGLDGHDAPPQSLAYDSGSKRSQF